MKREERLIGERSKEVEEVEEGYLGINVAERRICWTLI